MNRYFKDILTEDIDDESEITHYQVSGSRETLSKNRLISYHQETGDDTSNTSGELRQMLSRYILLEDSEILEIKEDIKNNKSKLTEDLRRKLINNYDEVISDILMSDFKNSASDSGDESRTSSNTSTNSMKSEDSDKYYTKISQELSSDIKTKLLDTTFLSDPNFNLHVLGRKMGTIMTIDDIVLEAKKCLILVLQDDSDSCSWYAYYPDGIKKTTIKNLNMYTYLIPQDKEREIKLGSLIMKYRPYGFVVATMKEIPNLNILYRSALKTGDKKIKQVKTIKKKEKIISFNDRDAFSIYKYGIDIPLTHIFLHYKFDTEKEPYYNTGKELVESYRSWKYYYMSLIKREMNEAWYEKVHNEDNIFSSKTFTVTIPIWTDADDKKIYRKEQSKERWRIYRKQ